MSFRGYSGPPLGTKPPEFITSKKARRDRGVEAREILDRVDFAAPRGKQVDRHAHAEAKEGDIESFCGSTQLGRSAEIAPAVRDENHIALAKSAAVTLDDRECTCKGGVDASAPAAALGEGNRSAQGRRAGFASPGGRGSPSPL